MSDAIDVSGLTLEAIHQVKSLVDLLRSRDEFRPPNQRDPEGWSAALRKWAASHPIREIDINDTRDTLYDGRGE